MSSFPTREEAFKQELLRALRTDNDTLVRGVTSVCRKLYGNRSLGNLLWGIPKDEAFRLLDRGGRHRISVLSEHPNGWVREKAVDLLRQTPGETLAPLLRRVRDWARPVAAKASRYIRERLPDASEKELQAIAPLVFNVTRGTRQDFSPVARAYLDEVARRPGLSRRLRQNSQGVVARWLFANLLGLDESNESLLRQALSHGDPGVVGWASGHAAAHPSLHALFYASRSSELRRRSLEFAPAEIREAGLLDLHAGVRNDARFILGKRDYAEHYRRHLPRPGAVSGLGETGTPADADLLRPLLVHPDAEVRRRAVESLYRLIENGAEVELWTALRDSSRRVQRSAAESLALSSLALDPESFLDLNLSPRNRRLLLERSHRWRALVSVLKRPQSIPNDEIWLQRWVTRAHRNPIVPTSDQAVDVAVLLTQVGTLLHPEVVREIRAALKSWAARDSK